MVGGAEGVGGCWWRVGNRQVSFHRSQSQRQKHQRGGYRRYGGGGRSGEGSETGRDVSCS